MCNVRKVEEKSSIESFKSRKLCNFVRLVQLCQSLMPLLSWDLSVQNFINNKAKVLICFMEITHFFRLALSLQSHKVLRTKAMSCGCSSHLMLKIRTSSKYTSKNYTYMVTEHHS
jgi:hypothetical protein